MATPPSEDTLQDRLLNVCVSDLHVLRQRDFFLSHLLDDWDWIHEKITADRQTVGWPPAVTDTDPAQV